VKDKLIVFVAQGFGAGRIPRAPGTFGSVLGLGWFALLLLTGNIWAFAVGTILGLLASVWFCGRAEKILGQTDPGSVVLDEIAAMPVCFGLLVVTQFLLNGSIPVAGKFFTERWDAAVFIFIAFRVFDVWKPGSIRKSQNLPGGWGVTADDFLAAIYTNAGFVALMLFRNAVS
jgi:phosphatidylglycerophosphatase A